MSFQTLLLSIEASVATLTLNLPKSRNAFTPTLLRELHEALDRLAQDPGVRALILTGAGAGFCAGADLGQSLGPDATSRAQAGADQLRDHINPLATKLRAMPFPVISAVNGGAAGAGASLALAADVVIAARSAFFLFPFMPRLGILPDLGATWQVTQRLGPARAMALFLIGDRLAATQAAHWGLIWRCTEDADLLRESQQLAARLAQGPAHAAGELRQAIALAQQQDLTAQLDYELLRQRDLLGGEAFGEGVQAFMEKREPRFAPRKA